MEVYTIPSQYRQFFHGREVCLLYLFDYLQKYSELQFQSLMKLLTITGYIEFHQQRQGLVLQRADPEKSFETLRHIFLKSCQKPFRFFQHLSAFVFYPKGKKKLKERRVSMAYVSFFKLLHILSYHDKLLCHVLQAIPLIIKP